MIKHVFTILISVLTLGGCATKEIVVEPVPDNFVVRQNSAALNEQLHELNKQDYVVKFARGKEEISNREKERLALWLEQTQPTMIAVRGTAGAQKYSELGEARKIATISQIFNNHSKLEIIPLDYDATLPGGRAVIEIVSDDLAGQIRNNAPILIIRSD